MTSFLRFLFALCFIGFAGCLAAPEPQPGRIEAAPGSLVFHPETDQIRVELRNVGDQPVPVQHFRIEGPDWDAFSIVEPLNPTMVPPGQSLQFNVRVDAKRFYGPEAQIDSVFADLEYKVDPGEDQDEEAEEVDEDEYRNGTAVLRYTAGTEDEQAVPIEFEDPPWWLGVLVALIKIHLVALGFVLPLAALLTWVERKQSAMMQDRVGPNMARISIGNIHIRLWGLIHIATDGIKMLFKEDFVPRRAHRVLYTLAPLMALVPVMVVFAIIPFGDALCWGRLFDVLNQADIDQCAAGRGGTALQVAHIDVGLLFYFAIASLGTWGATLAGWASYNKWAILGALRASAQMISYEVAIGLTIVGALLVYGSLEPHAIVHAQLDSQWGIIFQPIAFVLFFTAAIAETKRAPFDLPEGESEIIGYFIEYSGMRFGLFFLSEFMEIVFVGAMVTTLFFGGWALPFGMFGANGFTESWVCAAFFAGAGLGICAVATGIWRASARYAGNVAIFLLVVGSVHLAVAVYALFTGWGTQMPHFMVVLVWMLTWGIKVALLCCLQMLIRWTLPRFRYDQLMGLGWKGLLPLSVANIVLTAIVVYLFVPTQPGDEPTEPPPPASEAAAADDEAKADEAKADTAKDDEAKDDEAKAEGRPKPANPRARGPARPGDGSRRRDAKLPTKEAPQ